MKLSVLLLLLASVGAGCRGLGPAYERPAIVVPEDHRGALTAGGAENMADLPWWEVYKDPVLQALVREALAANPDLKIACARVEQARALLGITHADGQPQVNLSETLARVPGAQRPRSRVGPISLGSWTPTVPIARAPSR